MEENSKSFTYLANHKRRRQSREKLIHEVDAKRGKLV